MDAFDLGRLTDIDFEAICQDLFTEILGERLELFAPGADGGVDLRYFAAPDVSIIIQCKHWFRSSAAKLVSHMRDSEKSKVVELSPARYILATTVDLSKNAKDSLFKLLSPYVLEPADIWGLRDIVQELGRRPSIVRRHLRLWLSSTEVLGSLLNRNVLLRSRDLVEDATIALKTYVPNASYTRAMQLLDENHVCIVSGLPGVGKTTLAQVLAAAFSANGYELIEVSADAEEVNQTWSDETPQFLYYDDFLGQTSLAEKLNKNEDVRLIRLIKRVHDSPNKRLVLTTREYILAQAQDQYEKFSRHDFNPLNCVIDLADYTRLIKGEVLYNHIFFSSIPADMKADFASPEVYLPLISHPNFNPRLIEMSLSGYSQTAGNETAATFLQRNLKNPGLIWSHIVNNQLNEAELRLLELLATLPRSTSVQALNQSWSAYGERHGYTSDSRIFNRTVHILEGTMIRLNERGSVQGIDFHNPSIRDYVGGHLGDSPDRLAMIIEAVVGMNQMRQLLAASTSVNSGRLREALVAQKALMEQVGSRILSEVAERGELLQLTDVQQAFLAADELDSDLLRESVKPFLKRAEMFEYASDGDELIALVRLMHGSTDPEIRELTSWAIDLTVEWLTGDLSDWDSATSAQTYLNEIDDLVDGAVIQSVDETVDELARDTIQSWSEGWHREERNIDEILEYAAQQFDSEGAYPGYQEVRELVSARREMRESPRSGSFESSASDDLPALERMFSSLRVSESSADD